MNTLSDYSCAITLSVIPKSSGNFIYRKIETLNYECIQALYMLVFIKIYIYVYAYKVKTSMFYQNILHI